MSRVKKCRVCGRDDTFHELIVWPPASTRVGPRTYECVACLDIREQEEAP